MNAVAGATVDEAIDTTQKGERACAVALARKERAGVEDAGRGAALADDPAQLHPGEQVAAGRVEYDRDPPIDTAEGCGEPIGRAGVDASVEIDERRLAKRAGSRSRRDPDGEGRGGFRGRG